MQISMKPFLLCFIIAIVVVSQTDACSCYPPNPNVTQVCNPDVDFAAKAKLKNWWYYYEGGLEYYEYKVQIIRWYKASAIKRWKYYYIYSPTDYAACGIDLYLNNVYLLTGRVDTFYEDVIDVSSCNWFKKFKDLTGDEKNYLKSWEGHCCQTYSPPYVPPIIGDTVFIQP